MALFVVLNNVIETEILITKKEKNYVKIKVSLCCIFG